MYKGGARVCPFVIGAHKFPCNYYVPIYGTVLCTWVELESVPIVTQQLFKQST